MSQSALAWILGFALLGSVGAIGGATLFLMFPKSVREERFFTCMMGGC